MPKIMFFCQGQACDRQIHLLAGRPDDDEPKFRVDLSGNGQTRGYDVCADCFERVAALLEVEE